MSLDSENVERGISDFYEAIGKAGMASLLFLSEEKRKTLPKLELERALESAESVQTALFKGDISEAETLLRQSFSHLRSYIAGFENLVKNPDYHKVVKGVIEDSISPLQSILERLYHGYALNTSKISTLGLESARIYLQD